MKNKRKRRDFEDLDFRKVIIDISGKQFSLKKKDDAIDAPLLSKLIITRARQGATLSMILFDCGIRNSKWTPFIKRNKKVRLAISDAIQFHKAYGQRLLSDMANGRKAHSPIMAKMMMVSFYDIKDEYVEPTTNKTGSGSSEYKVVTTMTKEETSMEPIFKEEK